MKRFSSSVASHFAVRVVFLCVSLIAAVSPARAATVTWINPAGGSWNNPANWTDGSINRIPTGTDNVVIDLDASYVVSLNTPASVTGIVLGAAAGVNVQTLDLVASGLLTTTGPSTFTSRGFLRINGGTLTANAGITSSAPISLIAGTLTGTGAISQNGSFTWSGGSISGTGSLNLGGGYSWSGAPKTLIQRQLTANSSGTWDGSTISSGQGATFGNSGGLSITGDGNWLVNQTGTTAINNAGAFTKNGGAGVTLIEPSFNQSGGNLATNVGEFRLTGGGTSNGGFFFGLAGTVTNFAGGVHNVGVGTTIDSGTGALGTIRVSGGSTTFAGAYNQGPLSTATEVTGGIATFNANHTIRNMTISGGEVTGTGTFAFITTLNWTGGRLSGTGPMTAGDVLMTTGPRDFLNRTLTVNAQIVWDGSTINSGNGATIVNTAFSLFRITGAGSWLHNLGGAAPVITTAGGFLCEPAGTVSIAGSLTQTAGSMGVTAGSTLMMSAINLNGGSAFGEGIYSVPTFVQNAGIFNPGNTPVGISRINGGYQQNGGTLQLDIGGTTPGTGHDQLIVSGSVFLAGAFQTQSSNTSTPPHNSNYTIITCGSCAGNFSNASSTINTSTLTPTVNLTSVVLNAATPAANVDLSLLIGTNEEATQIGRPITIFSRVENLGPNPARDLVVTMTITGATVNSVNEAACSLAGNTITCTFPSIGVNQIFFGTANVTSTAIGPIVANASVTTPDNDTNAANNNATRTVQVVGPAITVNQTTDAADALLDGLCDVDLVASGSQCSLRAAIQEANFIGGSNNITVPAGTYQLTIPGVGTSASSGDLDISDGAVTITGASALTTIINGGGLDRIFDLRLNADVTISNLSIENGVAQSGEKGGAIRSTNSILFLSNVEIRGSRADAGGAISNVSTSGFFFGGFASKSEVGAAGAFAPPEGVLRLQTVTLANNSAIAGAGGAIDNFNGQVTILDSTISGNTASTEAGAIRTEFQTIVAAGETGAMVTASSPGEVLINTSTVTANTAPTAGGLRNQNGAIKIYNSIVAQNVGGDCGGAMTSLNFNIAGDATCALTGANDQSSVNPNLGPLANNGGQTRTHLPLTGSAAIDSGDPTAPAATDQRGVARPQDGNGDSTLVFDIGSVEVLAPLAPVVNTFTATPSAILVGNSSTLTWTTSNATTVSISNGVGAQAVNGSVSVTPAATITYTLTATGPGGTITATATVTVNTPPAITSFTATPTSIITGASSTLSWSTTNATSVIISNGVGSQPVSGSVSVTPTLTTTYTLTATGPGGTITATATVTVNTPPAVTSFTASPTSIITGASSTLSWTTTNATSVIINNGVGSQPVSGSVSVSPTLTTTYTLTATGPGGTITANVTVTVNTPPAITSFTASPTSIIAGASSTLSWSTTNATSVTISNGVGTQPVSGSVSVTPTSTTTYTLTATGPGGSTTATATVTVSAAAPVISSFNASPPTINVGASSTLAWSTVNATSVTISNGVGAQAVNGTVVVSPTATTVYTLTATGPGGTNSSSVTVTVNPLPVISSFAASPPAIIAGSSSTLAWTTSNTTSVMISNGVGSQPVNGSIPVSPTVTTVYTLTATGPGGSTTANVTVTVNQPAPSIGSFSATPASIIVGNSSTLSWSTTNATSVTINNGVGSQPVNGSVPVSPTVTTIYTLTATGPGGSTTANVTVTVNQPAPSIGSFSATPASIIAGNSSTLSWSTTNATSVTINNGVGSQPVNGSISVSPANSTTYTLTATGPGGSSSASAVITVAPMSADLSISKTAATLVAANANLTYSILVKNSGPSPAANVAVIDTLPANTTFVSMSSTQGTCTTGSPLNCAIGTLASGAQAAITLVVRAGVSGIIVNTASVSSTVADPNAANNSSQATTTIFALCTNSAPVLVAPANGSVNLSSPVTLQWNLVADATQYRVFTSINGTLSQQASVGAGQNTLTLSFPEGATVEWFVQAEGFRNSCPPTVSGRFRFTTIACSLAAPSITEPLSGATDFLSPVTVRWTAIAGAVSYRVTLLDSTLASQTQTVTSTAATFNVAPGSASVSVVAINSAGCESAPSQARTFRTIACGTPEPPLLAAPGEVTTGNPYAVSWLSRIGATSFEIQESAPVTDLSLPIDFAGGVTRTVSALATQYQHTVRTDNRPIGYFYRIRAIAGCNGSTSAFSSIVKVVILPKPQNNDRTDDLVTTNQNPQTLTTTVTICIDNNDRIIPCPTGKAAQALRVGPTGNGTTATVTTSTSWLSVTPSTVTIPPNGSATVTVTANPGGLPVGTSTGSVTATTSTGSRNTTPVSISLVTPVSPLPKADEPPQNALIIPAAAHVDGLASSLWQSDVRVTNTASQKIRYAFTFTPSGVDGAQEGKTTEIEVGPGQTIAMDDMIKRWYGQGSLGDGTNGTLEIRPLDFAAKIGPDAISFVTIASSRSYNKTSTGTLGQFVPAIAFANFVGKSLPNSPSSTLSLQQIVQNASYRTNLGLVEGSGKSANVEVTVFNATGQPLTSFTQLLKPFEHQQLNSFLAQRGIILNDGRVEVKVLSDTGRITTYASVVDSITNDPLLVPGVQLSQISANKFVLPGVADFNNGSASWRTDLRVFNASNAAVTARIDFYEQDQSAPKVTTVQVAPGEVKSIDNILRSVFDKTNTGGAVHVTTPTATSLVVSGRTYDQRASGTYGQFIGAVTEADAVGVGGRALQIQQLEESDRFRTNLGIAEVSGKPVTVEITAIVPDSLVAPKRVVTLQANQFSQLTQVIRSMNLTDVYNARITLRVISGEGKITAYGSVVDNQTQDPTFVPAQ